MKTLGAVASLAGHWHLHLAEGGAAEQNQKSAFDEEIIRRLREAMVKKIPEFYEIISQTGGGQSYSYLLLKNY